MRVVLFSLVLTTAAAPQASLFCKLLCQPSNAAIGCQHHIQTTTASVTTDDGCGVAMMIAPSVIREAGLRAASRPDAAQAVIAPRDRLVRPVSDLLAASCCKRAAAVARRPLETALRL